MANLYFYAVKKDLNAIRSGNKEKYIRTVTVVPVKETAKQYKIADNPEKRHYLPYVCKSTLSKNELETVFSHETPPIYYSAEYIVILNEENHEKATRLLNAEIDKTIERLSEKIKFQEHLKEIINAPID